MRFLPFALALSWLTPAWAIHSSEAGVVDWHTTLVGVPLTDAISVSPLFHTAGPSTQSVVLTATTSNVLAALHPENGSIAWRHIFDDEEERVIGYKAHGDAVAAVSGHGGAIVRLLDVATGELVLETRLHSQGTGRSFVPETLGTAIDFDSGSGDVFVLSNAFILRRVSRQTGAVVWGWAAPDQTSVVAYSRVVATPEAVYVVGLAKGDKTYALHAVAIDPTTGKLLAYINVPSSIFNGMTDFVTLKAPEAPGIAWFEDGVVKAFVLTPDLKKKPSSLKGPAYKGIFNAGSADHGQLVALTPEGEAHVLMFGSGGLRKIKESSEKPYSVQISAEMVVGGKDVTGSVLPVLPAVQGTIKHVVRDRADPERLLIITSTGAVQLWYQDKLQWSREESLTDIKVAEMIELPERKIINSRSSDESETSGARLARQLSDAQDFPQYAVNFVRRFVTGSYASVSASVAPAANASEPLSRDAFGFRKIIVAVTSYGKVFGIDSADGQIVWSRTFGVGWAKTVGAQIIPVKLFVTRSVSDGDVPQVVIVTQRKANNGLVDTVLFHIDALTGDDARRESSPDESLKGFDAIAGPLVESYLLRSGSNKVVVLLDEFVQACIYPDTPENEEILERLLPSLRIPLRMGTEGQRKLTGHQLSTEKEFTGKHVAFPVWSISFPPAEEIISLVPRALEPVASLGKVLGNRTTLYKYLNPHLVAVVTGTSTPSGIHCNVYLVDGAKGTVIYHAMLPSASGMCHIDTVLTENWLVYHYYDGESSGVHDAKSYRVVSVELYEGAGVDDKKRSSDMSSFSNESTAVTVFEQAYVFPRAVTTIATTSTSYGISVKDLIVANENGQIQSFSRRLLDPRRPKAKPTTEEMEELLIQYDAVLPDDPKRVLSHHYNVAKTRRIITSPALLESTSLVFAYGLDLFSTRVAPSGTFDVLNENFNKAQLVLTIAALGLAIVVAKPMVQRKRLRERWFD